MTLFPSNPWFHYCQDTLSAMRVWLNISVALHNFLSPFAMVFTIFLFGLQTLRTYHHITCTFKKIHKPYIVWLCGSLCEVYWQDGNPIFIFLKYLRKMFHLPKLKLCISSSLSPYFYFYTIYALLLLLML